MRINVAQSEQALLDLKAIFSSKKLPNALVVPKVNTIADLEWVCDNQANACITSFIHSILPVSQVFDKVERLKHKSALHASAPPIRLITQCETAIGETA